MSKERLSQAEENYLKAIFKLTEQNDAAVNTNSVAGALNTSAASVTDMLKRLSEKGLVGYERYKGAKLTEDGQVVAKQLIRKHRLWEVFLVNKLGFTWDEVHEVAEQLEHIRSAKLTNELDKFLDYPKFDPHGDPIPDSSGHIGYRKQLSLSKAKVGGRYVVVGVSDTSKSFLQFLDGLHIKLGNLFTIENFFEYDGSMSLINQEGGKITVSKKVSENIFVRDDS